MLAKLNKIFVYGDSLMRGVVLGRDQKYTQLDNNCVCEVSRSIRIEIENKSIFGMTVPKALTRFFSGKNDEAFRKNAVLLEYGGNDCNFNLKAISKDPHGVHLPATDPIVFEKNLIDMTTSIKKSGGSPVLMTLPPIHSERFLDWICRDGLSRENILLWLGDVEQIYRWQEKYNRAIERVAYNTRTPLLDVRGAFLNIRNYADCLCEDGMHLNEQGHRMMAHFLIGCANRYRYRFEE